MLAYIRCIPVIIADGIVLPFESMLDYSTFTVKVTSRYTHCLCMGA